MNKAWILLIFLIFTSHASVIYTVDVDRTGLASVTLSLEGEEAAVPLPEDARNFRIVGGTYSVENSTVLVAPGKSGFTTFSFLSDIFTEKTGSGWRLSFVSPENADVNVYMPPYTTIESSVPVPRLVSSDDSRTVLEMRDGQMIMVSYRLEEVPVSQVESDFFNLYLLVGALLLGIFVREAFVLLKKKPAENAPSFKITPGKKEMMETFNENDMAIVNFLLENQGKSKRNVLERSTGVSKSSLAMALNRLEKRKIVEMDKTATTHFVKLTEYFLKL